VGWGHYLLGLPISLFSNLGIIALVGVLVNDTLVLISNYNQRLEAGMPQMEALYEAGVSRFRPILLTSLTTFAGLAPLLLEKSLQAQFLIPMAASVSFGLLVITLVILVLLPVLLIVVNRFKVYASWAWNGVKPSYESVEPATGAEGGYQYIWLIFFMVLALVVVLNMVI
jgi:multidrug efflux pump subunit AcrB